MGAVLLFSLCTATANPAHTYCSPVKVSFDSMAACQAKLDHYNNQPHLKKMWKGESAVGEQAMREPAKCELIGKK